jgi:sugar phosphate isomerase/epimerase
VPEDVLVMVEPTDREIDKKKFIGPSSEAVRLARRIHEAGCPNFSSMIDMCHLPLMGETIEEAMRISAGHIGHIHLGNCIREDREHPLFGDKHPAWGLDGGSYDVPDIADLIQAGLGNGYFSESNRGSASFEMQAYEDVSPQESINRFFDYLLKAWDRVEANAAVAAK